MKAPHTFLISSEKYIVLATSQFHVGIITGSIKDRSIFDPGTKHIKLSYVLELTPYHLSFATVTSQP